MRYATRNHALVPATTWVLDGAVLRQEDDKGPPQVYALKDAREVRLEFAPTRPEPDRFRCRVVFAGGRVAEFFNRTYRGVYDFADTSAAYVAFVHALLAALREHAPACRFVSGAGATNYALSVAGFVVAAAVLGFVMFFVLASGLWWLVLLKAAIMLFYFPAAWRWLRRNREREFDPVAPPTEVLPASAQAIP